MKIALVFDKDFSSTTGIYFERALERTNHKFTHFWTKDAADIPKGFDLYLRIDHGDYKYDLPDTLHPAAFYIIDTHLKKPFKKIARQVGHYDYILCTQKNAITRLKRFARNAEIHWVPLGCDPEIHRRMELKKLYDVGFVGTEGKKSPRLKYLIMLKQKYPRSFIGRLKFPGLSEIYSRSKIGFNHSINNGVNMRMFEIPSCGAMLLTNQIKDNGFLELFQPGRDVVVYRNARECIELIDYYLAHEDERKQIAEAAHAKFIKSHTYMHRLEQILDIVGNN